MKPLLFSLILLALPAPAQESVVVERGPHHQVHESVRTYQGARGVIHYKTNYITELADNLCYITPQGNWETTKQEFEVFQDGFTAHLGPMKVTLNANLNVLDAIDVTFSDGQRFQAAPAFLALRDGAGQSVLIAAVQDCVGRLIAPGVMRGVPSGSRCSPWAGIRWSSLHRRNSIRPSFLPSSVPLSFLPSASWA